MRELRLVRDDFQFIWIVSLEDTEKEFAVFKTEI